MFVADAVSLLDIAEADSSIIRLVRTHLGDLRIPALALDKVGTARAKDLRHLGVTVHKCTTEQLLEAGPNKLGLSFAERLSLITARDGKWTFVTHDRVLNRVCGGDGLTSLCALDLVIHLLEGAHILSEAARTAASNLRRVNPIFMTQERVDRCISQIKDLDKN